MANLASVACNSCKQVGGLSLKKVHRMSTPVVVIGWLFLIPSFLGMSCGACGLLAGGKATSKTSAAVDQEYTQRVTQVQGIRPEQVQKVLAMPFPDEDSLRGAGLTRPQRDAVKAAYESKTARGAGAAIAGGLFGAASLVGIITSFVGGLLGWILIMKKRVIACRLCGGIHSDAV